MAFQVERNKLYVTPLNQAFKIHFEINSLPSKYLGQDFHLGKNNFYFINQSTNIKIKIKQ